MSDSNSIFSGSSRFASDFQQVINRAVAIASLPLQQLNNQRAALSAQSTALDDLDGKFSGLQTAIQHLQSAAGDDSFSTSVSDASIVRATLGSAPLAGTYSVEVVSLGSATNTLSADDLPKVTNPFTENISAAASFTLSVDGSNYTVTPEANSLSALARAINSADAGVQATIVNIGSSSSPDYRLSIQSTRLDSVNIQLNDGGRDLLNTLSTGSAATYRVNGQPATPISSESRTITLSPGLTVDLLKVGTTEITVSRTGAAIRDALSSFVNAFNASVDELDKHRGSTKGALTGQSILFTLAQSLRDVGAYSSGSGQISSLTSLGLVFTKQGKLSFDQDAFTSVSSGNLNDLLTFLGNTGSGGFLKAANDTLDQLEGSTDGLIQLARGSIQKQITSQDQIISDNQLRIELMRENLTAKIAAADALIASLEQNVILFNGLFQAMANNGR